MLKFDWITYNSTDNLPGGPVSQFVHDETASFGVHEIGSLGISPPVKQWLGVVIDLIVVAIMIALHYAAQ